MHASICTSSRSSMRATGMHVCIAALTVLTALARSGNWQTAPAIASGTLYKRSWIWVHIHSDAAAHSDTEERLGTELHFGVQRVVSFFSSYTSTSVSHI